MTLCVSTTFAQYPKITKDVQAETERRTKAATERSDAAWDNAQAAIKAGAAHGRPYLPWAATPEDLPQAKIPAFPGAEGGGMYSFGGRGGKVFVVTNLNDSGPGSFRAALEAGGPRIVVFNVAGIIRLKEKIRIRAPYITIDGGSAPGDGVCIAGNTVELETHDVVIRNMRFRRGESWVGDRNDSCGGNPIGNIMIDHVSASWGLDENMSMYRHMYQPPDGSKELKLPTVNITIQNSIFSEALGTYNHSFGSTIGGYNSMFHHNLWACNAGRNPSVGMIYDFNFINNVVYNWHHRTTDGGDHRSFYTIQNNYLKPGPVTPLDEDVSYRLLKPESRRSPEPTADFGKAYVAGNIVDGNEPVTKDNWDGGVQVEVDPRAGVEAEDVLAEIRSDKPYPHAYVSIEAADEAYEHVLANAGAVRPKRDAVDERVVEMVRSGTVTARPNEEDLAAKLKAVGYADNVIESITEMTKKGIISNIDQVGGYPEYKGTPYADADNDGLPDDWETKHGLDPRDPADAAGDLNGDGYTNIEDFLNGLDPRAEVAPWHAPQGYVDVWKGRTLD
ncbi:MAG: pectate lyase [Pirellulales bacterium]